MDRRTAKRLADEDDTPYGVLSRSPVGYLCLVKVTGYSNAQVVRNAARRADGQAVILTLAEMQDRSTWPELVP